MKRLFFALWPSEQTRKKIDNFNQSLKLDGLRKVNSANLHVTLLFLGNTDVKTERLLREMAENISVRPFELQFDQLGFWQKPKILCLTTQHYDAQLTILVDALNHIVEQCGMRTEVRPYKPHITLVRKVQKPMDINVLPIAWQVNSFCLIESCSTLNGAVYQVLQRWHFAA